MVLRSPGWAAIAVAAIATGGNLATAAAAKRDTAPVIAGDAIVGQNLTIVSGAEFNGSPSSVADQWQRCDAALDDSGHPTGCGDIPGASASTYELEVGDFDRRVRLVQTATYTRGGRTRTRSSASAPTEVVAPGAPSISSGPATGSTTGPSVSFSFAAAEAGATLECRLDDAEFSICASPATTSGLTEGSHIFAVRARGQHGNIGPETARAWNVDATAPAPPTIILLGEPRITDDREERDFELTYGGEADVARFECRLNSGAVHPCSHTGFTIVVSCFQNHRLAARAVDTYGNASSWAIYSWTACSEG